MFFVSAKNRKPAAPSIWMSKTFTSC